MKEILTIAIPAMMESVVAVVITSLDTKMISVLGKEAVSAVSFTNQPKLMFFAIFYALGTTTSIFVAQALGRKDREEADACFHLALKIAVILSPVLGTLAGLFAEPVMHLCNRQADTVGLSVTFFRIIMSCMLFQNVSVILNAALRGIGKTSITMLSGIVMGAVDIGVNYLLIEGHCGFPRLEVAGDAIATVCGTIAACAVSAFFLLRKSDFISLQGFFSGRKPERGLAKQVRARAVHVVSENLMTRLGFLLSSIIVSTLGSAETAVYSVAMILLNYSFAFGDGLQATAVTLIGRSMGADALDILRRDAQRCRLLGCVVSAVLGTVYIFGARWFFGTFFADAASVELGMRFSYIAAALTFLQILRIVNIGIMRGIGDVKTPMILSVACVLLINPGVSWLLVIAGSCEIWGIWTASIVSQGVWFAASVVKSRQLLHSAEFEIKSRIT